VTPDGSKLYVANVLSNTVSAIDAARNAVSATISVGSGPLGVAVTPDGSKVYVANDGGGANSVSVIDTATNAVSTITDPSFSGPVAFGLFIQPARPSAATLTPIQFDRPGVPANFGAGLNAAAAALHFPSVLALQQAIMKFSKADARAGGRALSISSRTRGTLGCASAKPSDVGEVGRVVSSLTVVPLHLCSSSYDALGANHFCHRDAEWFASSVFSAGEAQR
jgi:YVTN family beta-propeller protein